MKNTKQLHNQEDVNPSTEQEKIQQINEGELDEPLPATTGTGGNRALEEVENVQIENPNEEEPE